MLTQTTIIAIKVLIYVASQDQDAPIPVHQICQVLDAPQPYVAKINTELVKSRILRSHRGPSGGVTIARNPESISLLDVIQACQGKYADDYCHAGHDGVPMCAFHQAMHEALESLTASLSKWSVADMVARQCDIGPEQARHKCVMSGIIQGPEDE